MKRKIILTDKLEIHILEIEKIEEIEDNGDKLLDWLYFLENPESERVAEKMEENEELKEAVEKLDAMSDDDMMQRIADARLMAIMDKKAEIAF